MIYGIKEKSIISILIMNLFIFKCTIIIIKLNTIVICSFIYYCSTVLVCVVTAVDEYKQEGWWKNRVLGSDSVKQRAENLLNLTELRLISDQSGSHRTKSSASQAERVSDAISGAAMAVDLTPRFRRLNSQSCFSENKHLSGTSTRCIWYAVVYMQFILYVNCMLPLVYSRASYIKWFKILIKIFSWAKFKPFYYASHCVYYVLFVCYVVLCCVYNTVLYSNSVFMVFCLCLETWFSVKLEGYWIHLH